MSHAKQIVDELRIKLKESYEQSWRRHAAMLDSLEAFLVEDERRLAEIAQILMPPVPPPAPHTQIYAGPEQDDRALALQRWEEAVGRRHAPEGHGG